MKILLTGAVQSFADKKGTAVLEVVRKAKDGPTKETYYLKFHSDEAYQNFKGRYAPGDCVQVIGLLRQVQVPMVDCVTKAPLLGSNGRELRNGLLSVEVKEHKPAIRDEYDTLYAHGLVSIIEKRDLAQSAGGKSYLKARVVYQHYKRSDEEQGQGDFYDVIAFSGQATSLDNLEKGKRFVIDYAIPAQDSYEMRDITHSDGSPVMRNGLELVLREFSFLPRTTQAGDSVPARAGEEIPF